MANGSDEGLLEEFRRVRDEIPIGLNENSEREK